MTKTVSALLNDAESSLHTLHTLTDLAEDLICGTFGTPDAQTAERVTALMGAQMLVTDAIRKTLGDIRALQGAPA